MKKGRIWILVSALLALTMALAACKPATTTTPGTSVTGTVKPTTSVSTPSNTSTLPPTSTVPTIGTETIDTTPVYGGVAALIGTNPTRWDPGELIFNATHTPYLESLTGADWTKGPQ
ncbi:MAG: hypothetical protein PHE50_06575, partial [Dehalococcoidales bacterium]|nr:hypothetical protein [Dehalococcoidales bacterium]